MSSPMTSAGDMIVGGVAGAPARLAAASAGYILRVVGGTPVWRELSAAGLGENRPNAVAAREGQTYWSTDAAAGAQLSMCVHKGGATYAWEILAYGVTATGAALVQAADAAAARTALGVQDGPRFVSVCAFGSAGIVLDEIGGAQVDPADYAVAGRTLSLSLRLYGDVPSGTTATVRLWRLPREAWLVGTAYIEGEVVVSGGSSWRALVSVTGGSAPSEGATWTANTALASVAITAAYPTLSTASVTVPLSAAVYALDAQAVGAGLVTVRGAALRLTWS